MATEMTMDNDHENDDSTHHYPGHVEEEDVEVEVVEDKSENDEPVKSSKNITMIPWDIGVTIVTKAGVVCSSATQSGKSEIS